MNSNIIPLSKVEEELLIIRNDLSNLSSALCVYNDSHDHLLNFCLIVHDIESSCSHMRFILSDRCKKLN